MFALENGCPYTKELFRRVMESDDVTAFEYLLDKIEFSCIEFSWQMFSSSESEFCQIKKLRLLRKYGHKWNRSFCAWAAESGNLNVLRWLRFHGCAWDARTCSNAARGKYLSILKYAHENGCEFGINQHSNIA